jgi:hypothetical protein
LGKAPLKVKLTANYSNGDYSILSIGAFTAGGNTAVYTSVYGNGTSHSYTQTTSTSWAIGLGDDNADAPGTTGQTGVVTVDATNITITWTKHSTPSGTISFMWEAEA